MRLTDEGVGSSATVFDHGRSSRDLVDRDLVDHDLFDRCFARRDPFDCDRLTDAAKHA